MSNEPISGLPAASAALSTDLYCISQGGITKKLTENQLFNLIQTQISFPSQINIYNSDGSLTNQRTVDTNNFKLTFNGTGSVTLDTPDTFAAISGANAFTVGSNTYQGIANGASQLNKGKFNVVLNDDGGIYSNSFIRFSDNFPVTMVLGKARGTEAAPLPIEDGELVGVFAFGAHDGAAYSGLPNFNLTAGMFCLAAPGQATGNTPGSLLFNVNLSGESTGATFLSFNLAGRSESILGQSSSSTGLNSIVIGNNISSTVDEEILIGNTTGDVRISTPAINLESTAISLTSAPYSGGGVQYLTVNNSGLIVPASSPPAANIYNTDGTFNSNRTASMGGVNLSFVGTSGEQILFDVPATQIGTVDTQAFDIKATTTLNYAPFTGAGNQYLGVDNAGKLIPLTPAGSTNIYNADGTLTAARTVTLNSYNLTFIGAAGEQIIFDTGTTQIGTNNGQFFTVVARMFLNYSPFVGAGNQFLGVDGSGQIIPIIPPTIYTFNGTLSSNRIVTMLGFNLTFNGTAGFILNTSTIELGLSTSTVLQLRATTFINQSGFTGGGNQYIGVSNSGQLQVMSTPSSTNIYNADGSLTANRQVTLNTHDLTFFAATTEKLNFNSTVVFNKFAGGGATQYLYVDNTGLLAATTSVPTANIYNTDGTLTGNRTITLGAGGNDFMYFLGGGTFRIGTSLIASGIASFVQGVNNTVSTDRSVVLGGQHNDISGLNSGIFSSEQSTIVTKSGNVGYGSIIASYNTIGFDNFTVSIGAYNGVNNGTRSLLLGGQTNKINAPNVTGSSDCLIACGNTNTITGSVQNSSIFQSLNSVIGDNTNLITYAYTLNSSNCTLTQTNYMVDINGTGNNLSAQNAIVLNGHNCTLTATPGGVLDGRYFMVNANGCSLGLGGGFYSSLISGVNTTLNGSYCTAISTDGSQFSNVADHSVILGGNGHNMQAINSAILLGVGNTIGNNSNCGAIGSAITISHSNCIMINDGSNPLISSNINTVVISAGNGVGIGKGVEHPLQDVMLGRKLNVLTLNLAVNFATDTQQAIGYYVDTSGANKTMVLSDADKLGGTLFFVQKTSINNDLILLPASGSINGLPTLIISPGTTKGLIVGSDGTNWFTWNT